jgi:hypothetical protein
MFFACLSLVLSSFVIQPNGHRDGRTIGRVGELAASHREHFRSRPSAPLSSLTRLQSIFQFLFHLLSFREEISAYQRGCSVPRACRLEGRQSLDRVRAPTLCPSDRQIPADGTTTAALRSARGVPQAGFASGSFRQSLPPREHNEHPASGLSDSRAVR